MLDPETRLLFEADLDRYVLRLAEAVDLVLSLEPPDEAQASRLLVDLYLAAHGIWTAARCLRLHEVEYLAGGLTLTVEALTVDHLRYRREVAADLTQATHSIVSLVAALRPEAPALAPQTLDADWRRPAATPASLRSQAPSMASFGFS